MAVPRGVQSWRPWAGVLLAGWAAALAVAAGWAADDPGPDVRHPAVLLTARAAVAFWAVGCAGMLMLRPADWAGHTGRVRLVRWAWGLGALMPAAHVVAAFGLAHGWSHAAAVRHVAAAGGFGAGIVVNYLFAAVWLGDVLWWCADPAGYARRPPGVGRAAHGFLAFVTVNATVVFGPAGLRWVYAGLLAGLVALALWGGRGDPAEAVPGRIHR